MDKVQASNIVKSTFEKPFDKTVFIGFVKNLLNQIEEAPFTYKGNYINDSFKEYIASLERIGKYSDGEHKIDILIVQLKKETSIERARTMQRNYIAKYLNGSRGGEMKDAALVAFVSPNTEDWRFSLVKMDYKFEKNVKGKIKVKEEFTPARRWSFLVGTHENSHTAQSRLVPLISDDTHNPTLAELEESFNIEKVTKEFFEKYRELFLRTKEELDKIIKNNPVIKTDFENKEVNTVDFSKKLLGQIVFLYFLQKKGWFGVQRDSEWGTGSKQFLRELFEKKHGTYDNFFNDILEPLFYEALRIDRSHDDHYYKHFNCKIPFLNGGLFDPMNGYDWVKTDILISNELFSNSKKTKDGDTGDGILDIFDRYNFTVKEDEPLEKEVAIDPELLGKAYEKFNAIRPDNYAEFKKALKSGKKGDESKFNKQYGVYYTPREIVHYMCQQSLINYLYTELNKGIVTYEKLGEEQIDMFGNEGKVGQLDLTITHNSKPEIQKEDIETFVHYGEHVSENEAHVEKSGKETGTYYYKIPENIRKEADEIDKYLAGIKVCDPAIGSGAFPVGMMTEIVRARNALTPFIQNKNRSVYNFKRECIENSLYGVDIDPGAVEIAKLRLWLSLVVDEDDIKQIKPLPNLDYKIVCGNSLIGVDKQDLFKSHLLEQLEKIKPLYFNETNPTKKQEYKIQINGLITQITNGHLDFDFEIYFSEIFHEKGGFDVLIANPPYVGQKGNKNLFSALSKDLNFEKKMDYWYFFLHKAHELNKNNGITTFITPNYWVTANGAKKLREKIINGYYFIEQINFNENNIFEAGVHTNVFILQKSSYKNKSILCTIYNNQYESDFINHKDTEFCFFADQNKISPKWTGFIHFLPNDILVIINKLVLNCEKLSDNESIGVNTKGLTPGKKVTNGICNINQGIITGKDRLKNKENNIDNGVYVLTSNEVHNLNLTQLENKYIKPFIKNSNINHYFINNKSDLSIIYVDEIESDKEFKKMNNLFQHLKQYHSILKERYINGVLESAYKKGKWWALIHTVPMDIIINSKIVCPHRSKSNVFAYSESETYASADVYYISQNKKEYSLKFILSILNSKLIYFWLYWMGKKKGDLLELYFEPLQFIPIKKATENEQKPFITIVDKILAITQSNDYLQNQSKQAKVKEYEKEIDRMIYELYGLTPEEIKTVEGVK